MSVSYDSAKERAGSKTRVDEREEVLLQRKTKVEKEKLVEVELGSAKVQAPTASALEAFRKIGAKKRAIAKKERAVKRSSKFLAPAPKGARSFLVDLRIHLYGTIGCFSSGGIDPCPALVRLAKVKGLDAIAITDYFCFSFTDRVREAASNLSTKISVMPGVDLLCQVGECKEVSVVALFPESSTGAELSSLLVDLGVPKSAYGRKDHRLAAPFAEVLSAVEAYGGVVVPSRIDKTPYRQLAIPHLVEDYGLRAFDLVHADGAELFRRRWPQGGFSFFSFSNAHSLGQVGSRATKVRLRRANFGGIKERVARSV